MSTEEIRVPDLGGSDEVEVIEVNVKPGDTVAEEDAILTVESDKATVELPSPAAGKIQELKVSVGDRISEGDLVGTIETDADAGDEDDGEDASGDEKDEKKEDASPDEESAETPDTETGDEAASDDEESGQPEDENADLRAPEDAEAAPQEQGGGKTGSRSAGTGASRSETVKVPDIGGAENVPIIEVLVKEGDTIEVEDPLVTLESDKASMDVPSPFAGTVDKLLVKVDDTVSEGHGLLEMTVSGAGGDEEASDEEPEEQPSDAAAEPPAEEPREREASQKEEPAPDDRSRQPAQPEPETTAGSRVHAGPAVRKLARELGADLSRVKGSGPKKRILKEDVQGYIKQQLKQSQGAGPAGGGALPGVKLPDFSQFGKVERRAMDRVHRLTAESMQRSWLNVPHVTQFEDADITDLEAFRKAQKPVGEKQGIKITPLPFILKACAYALQAQPAFNVSLDMDKREVVQKHYIHIGIAVDTPAGLVVPVIRDVDQKGIWELAREAQELAERAREKKLKPAEMQGACFTITSLGGIGGTAFTPIVNTPEVAILGVSKASMKPVWDGEDFQPRLMLPLSLSYDHRAINGAEAARFTSLLKRLLEDMRELMM